MNFLFQAKTKLPQAAILAWLSAGLAGCNSDVSINWDNSASSTSGGASQSLLTLKSINTLAAAAWTLDTNQKPNFPSRTFALEGTCSRGVASVKALIDGSASGNPGACASNGTFSFSVSVPTDGAYTLALQPVNGNGTVVTDAGLSQSLVADTTAPGGPVITQGASYISGTATFSIDGTVVGGDVVSQIVETNGNTGTVNYSSSGGTFVYTITIPSAGTTKTLKFVAKDMVGNTSSTTTINVGFVAGATLAMGGATGGFATATSVTSGTSSNTLGFATSPWMISPTNPKTGASGNKLYLGIGAASTEGP